MADVAGFGFNVGGHVDFVRMIGIFDFTGFVVNANVFDFRKPADIGDDLVDVVPGIEHHGIVGAQAYGGRQPVGCIDDVLHELFFLIIDVEIGPRRDREQKDEPYCEDQLRYESSSDFAKNVQHNFSVLSTNEGLLAGPRLNAVARSIIF